MNTELRKDCPMRHENGNCQPAGGFCTAVNDPICEALHNAYYAGKCGAWIPVTEEMPKEHKSIIPGCGTVSNPVLIAFVCTTSEEPYPKNCVVCEGMAHNGVFTHKSYSGDYKAIAWMHKPEPPK